MRGHELPYDGAVARSAWRNPVNWISEFSLSGFTRGGIVGVRDVSWLARSAGLKLHAATPLSVGPHLIEMRREGG